MHSSIQQFIQAIEEHRFIEAHELLEHDWKAYKKQGLKKEAKALQGLINGATALALYHIKKRPEAYAKIWAVFKKYQPLLNEVEFENMQDYFYANTLLMEKHKELIL